MAEYIEREAAIKVCDSQYRECLRKNDWCGDTAAWNIGFGIKGLPAADVVERKRGKWAYIGGDEWCCTNCGYVCSTEGRWEPMTANFCSECGADMRGE